MIRIERIPQPPPIPATPHYKLYCDYVLGDADGEHTAEAYISIKNPYIERFVTLLGMFDYLDFQLNEDCLATFAAKYPKVSVDDLDFLHRCMFPTEYKKGKKTKGKFKAETPEQTYFLDEFQYCIMDEDAGDMYPIDMILQESYLRYFDENSFEYYAHIEPNTSEDQPGNL